MLLPAGTILEVKIEYQANLQQCMNVLHYVLRVNSNDVTPNIISQNALDVFAAIGANSIIGAMRPLMSGEVAFTRVTTQFIHPTRFVVWDRAVVAGGDSAETCTAQNIALTIQKRAEVAGRHAQGSFHLGGIADDMVAFGFATAGAIANLTALATELQASRVVVGLTPSLFPAILNKVPIPNTDPVKYEISGATEALQHLPHDTIRVMRRRTVGLGV